VALSDEVRKLKAKWETGTSWPRRLDWVEIGGLRGWGGQRFDLRFPIMAVIGENGAGKSTVLQAAASVYAKEGDAPERYASGFFVSTPWDTVENATIRASVREGTAVHETSVRKPTTRWLGNPDRRKRPVTYIDLSRVQPIPARLGYTKLAKAATAESSAAQFDEPRLARFSGIMGRPYDLAKMALSDADDARAVPVVGQLGDSYSGFHQGAGETTIAELLQSDLPKYGLVLIDEVESSLHPRAQRRLLRDLATRCRTEELQIVLTTHSPYILEELPLEARAYIHNPPGGPREIIYGVSPEFAMTKMDEVAYYECELYVEDQAAERLLIELLAAKAPEVVKRCRTIPYGAASVGSALGIMSAQNRFPRPTAVFLDADREASQGCLLLPGDDAPERVVFEALKAGSWAHVHQRVGRSYSEVADALDQVMLTGNHHHWVRDAASALVLSGSTLWQAMCAEWAATCLSDDEAAHIVAVVTDLVAGGSGHIAPPMPVPSNHMSGVATPNASPAVGAEPSIEGQQAPSVGVGATSGSENAAEELAPGQIAAALSLFGDDFFGPGAQ
jgi:predicted ATPase